MNIQEKVIDIPCKKGYTSKIFVVRKRIKADEIFIISSTGLDDLVLSIKKSDNRWNFNDLFTDESQAKELVREILLTGYLTVDGYSDRYFLVPGVYDTINDREARPAQIYTFEPDRDNRYYETNLSMWHEFCARYQVNKNSFYIESIDTDVIVKKLSDTRALINLNANRFDISTEGITSLDRAPTRYQTKLLNFILANLNDFEVQPNANFVD